jgi:hypothetical protein
MYTGELKTVINRDDKVTEQLYLELAKSSQEKFKEYEIKNKKLTHQINQLKKGILSAYSLSRKVDEYLDTLEMPKTFKDVLDYLVGEIRNDLSTIVWNLESKEEIENLIEEDEEIDLLNIFNSN